MIAKLLGLLDLTCILVLLLSSWLPHSLIMFFAMLLFAKGMIFVFMGNIVSVFDAAAGIYLGLLVYGFHSFLITGIFVVFLAQKGILSLFAS